MKCLVTGGAGFIGSHLVDELVSLGHEVIVIDNKSAISNETFYWNDLANNYTYDVCDYDLTRSLYDGVDYVFHLAAQARIQPSINNPIETIKVNALGTATVLQCSLEANVKRVIYSSTSSIYGNNKIPNTEYQPADCLTAYSVSKLTGENLCKVYNDTHGLETVILRYFNVYGERQPLKGNYAPVIGLFISQGQESKSLTIVGDGEQKRDFTYVKDVVNANILAATKDVDSEFLGKVYNVGSGKNYSINQIALSISSQIEFVPKRIGEAKETLSNITKIKEVFGWKPNKTLLEWIGENK